MRQDIEHLWPTGVVPIVAATARDVIHRPLAEPAPLPLG